MDIKSAQAELSATQAKLTGIATEAKAANRDFTESEIAAIEEGADRAFQLQAAIRGLKSGETMRQIGDLGANGSNVEVWSGGQPTGQTIVGERKGFITPTSIKSMVSASTAHGIKALVTGGSSVTPVALDTNPIKLGGPTLGLGILSLIPTKVRDTPKYSYLRQTVRTNNADVVAPGALKPTSTFTVASVDGELKVVAHLSEYVDKFLLEDNSDLETFLNSELVDGIFAKVTALAVAGFAGTSGIQTQAFAVSAADSLYAGVSKVQDLGYNPNVLLIGRADYDAVRLTKSTTGEYLAGNAFEGGTNPGLWGMTTVISSAVTAGTALVLDSSKVGLSIDKGGVQTQWDAISKFDYNQLRARTEGRFGVDVFAPAAIAKVALKAA